MSVCVFYLDRYYYYFDIINAYICRSIQKWKFSYIYYRRIRVQLLHNKQQ